MIEARYRREYAGEFVITETKWANGRKHQTREWVPNPIENHHISGRAAVIGSDTDWRFDWRRLQVHRGGLLGKKRLQTYGTNNLWKEMKFDFFVESKNQDLASIIEKKYDEENIVYTTSQNCLRHPGHFYLVPLVKRQDNLCLAVYLAAFDGHNEIFMIGYSDDVVGDTREWKSQVNRVMQAYNTTQFILVGVESNMPEYWRQNNNVHCIDHNEFVTYCDV